MDVCKWPCATLRDTQNVSYLITVELLSSFAIRHLAISLRTSNSVPGDRKFP